MIEMPEDDYALSGNRVYFGTFTDDPDNVELHELGEAVSISFEGEGDDVVMYRDIFDQSEKVEMTLELTDESRDGLASFVSDVFDGSDPWYQINIFYRRHMGRPRFTVRILNRHKSWRGKWHRGGKGKV